MTVREHEEDRSMSGSQTRVRPAGASAVPGIKRLNPCARRLERCVALSVVVLPFAGFVAALALAWSAASASRSWASCSGCTYWHDRDQHRAPPVFLAWRLPDRPPLAPAAPRPGAMAAQGPVFYWAANHRRHHSYSDQPGDPHSPHLDHGEGFLGWVRGFWHAHLGWVFDHRIAEVARFIPDLLRDPVLARADRLYFAWVLLGLAFPALLGGVLIRSWDGAALASSGADWSGSSSASRPSRSSTRSVTYSAAGRSPARTRAGTTSWSRFSRSVRVGTTTTTPSPTRRCSAWSGGRSTRSVG